MNITVDKFGRVLIPKKVRDELGLEEGTSLQVKCSEDHVILTPHKAGSPLTRKGRVLVFKGVPEGDVVGLVKGGRLRRIAKLQGSAKK